MCKKIKKHDFVFFLWGEDGLAFDSDVTLRFTIYAVVNTIDTLSLKGTKH